MVRKNLLVGALIFAALGCGRGENPSARVTRLRLAHQVQPISVQNVERQGEPGLLLDFQVVNQGREKLSQLTVRVALVGQDGRDRAQHLVTLDTSSLLPGVAGLVSGFVPGERVLPGEKVRVEVVAQVPQEERNAYPEFSSPN